MTAPKMRILKFGSKTCGACIAMDRAKTLEKFVERHPNVSIVKFDVSDEENESPKAAALGDVDYEANMKLSDDYGVEALPTLVFEVETFGEMRRMEGAGNLKQLEAEYEKALEAAERYSTQAAALPWK